MWPFKKKQRPKVQLRYNMESGGFHWWSVWVWKSSWPGGYWVYVKGSSDEQFARELFESCKRHGQKLEAVVIEQS